jgi:hypothetical protein
MKTNEKGDNKLSIEVFIFMQLYMATPCSVKA